MKFSSDTLLALHARKSQQVGFSSDMRFPAGGRKDNRWLIADS